MIRCDHCDRFIDSDEDPGCFVEKPNYTNTAMPVAPAVKESVENMVLCESCREALAEEDAI